MPKIDLTSLISRLVLVQSLDYLLPELVQPLDTTKDIDLKDNIHTSIDNPSNSYLPKRTEPKKIDSKKIPKEEKEKMIEFIPGVISRRSGQLEKLTWILDYEPWDHVLNVIEEAKKRNKSPIDGQKRLVSKSVLNFIYGGLQNYKELYEKQQAYAPETEKEERVRVGKNIILLYNQYKDDPVNMDLARNQMLSLTREYEHWEDFGSCVGLDIKKYQDIVKEIENEC